MNAKINTKSSGLPINEQNCTVVKTSILYFFETIAVTCQEKTICIRGLFNKHFNKYTET